MSSRNPRTPTASPVDPGVDPADPGGSTDPFSTVASDGETDRAPGGLGLSAAQVAGSALAAVSGAFLASWMGVTGTLAGVAIGSIVGTVGSASYTYSLRRGHALVARPVGRPTGATAASRTEQTQVATAPSASRARLVVVPWRRLGMAAVVAALIGLGGLTLLESVTGRPVSSVAGGSTDSRTTLGSVLGQSSGSDDTGGGPASDTGQPDSGTPSGTDSGDDSGQSEPPADEEPTDAPTDQPEPDPTTPVDPAPDPGSTDPTPTPGPGGGTPVTP